MNRLRTNRSQNLNEAGEARATTKQRHLLGQHKKKARSTTHTTKKRLFLHNSGDSRKTTTSEKRLFFRRPDRTGISLRDKQQ